MDKPSSIGLYIKLINNIMMANMDINLKRYGVTFAQLGLLHLLKENGGTLGQKAIEDAYGMRHTSVIGILQRMEKKGFVRVSVDETDRRRRVVTLTELADGFFEDADRLRDEMERKLTNALTPDERACLIELLDKLYTNLSTGKDEANGKEADEVDTRI